MGRRSSGYSLRGLQPRWQDIRLFRPLPALLRLPIVLMPNWKVLHVEMGSCLCAMLLGAGAQARTLLSVISRAEYATRRVLAPSLIAAALLSGPAIMLGAKGPLLYHEPILWAWALAMLFVLIALGSLKRERTLTCPDLCAMSLCAGLCLLTRVTTGAGLCAATAMLIVRALHTHWLCRSEAGPLIPRWSWSPVLLLAVFILATAAVNEGRWHNPFEFADLRDQLFQIRLHPDRLSRLQHYGLFNPVRLGIGLMYYIGPVWTPALDRLVPIAPFLAARFDALELPASSFLITDPLWCVFAAYGVFLLIKRRSVPGASAVVAGLSFAPGLMLIAWYLAFRYRVEFAPLLFMLACLGLAPWAASLSGAKLNRAGAIVLSLTIFQIAATGFTSAAYSRARLGPTEGYPALMLFKHVHTQ